MADEDHNGTLSRSEFFKVARKFEYYEEERESLKIIIHKMKKSPTDVLEDDDLRKLLSVMLAARKTRSPSTHRTLNLFAPSHMEKYKRI